MQLGSFRPGCHVLRHPRAGSQEPARRRHRCIPACSPSDADAAWRDPDRSAEPADRSMPACRRRCAERPSRARRVDRQSWPSHQVPELRWPNTSLIAALRITRWRSHTHLADPDDNNCCQGSGHHRDTRTRLRNEDRGSDCRWTLSDEPPVATELVIVAANQACTVPILPGRQSASGRG